MPSPARPAAKGVAVNSGEGAPGVTGNGSSSEEEEEGESCSTATIVLLKRRLRWVEWPKRWATISPACSGQLTFFYFCLERPCPIHHISQVHRPPTSVSLHIHRRCMMVRSRSARRVEQHLFT